MPELSNLGEITPHSPPSEVKKHSHNSITEPDLFTVPSEEEVSVLTRHTSEDIKRDILLEAAEARPEVAQVKFLNPTEEGNFQDIEFSQHGKSISIKNILPIPHIEVVVKDREEPKRSHGYYEPKSKQVRLSFLSSEDEGSRNLILLHELSHAYDIQVNNDKYEPLMVQRVVREVLRNYPHIHAEQQPKIIKDLDTYSWYSSGVRKSPEELLEMYEELKKVSLTRPTWDFMKMSFEQYKEYLNEGYNIELAKEIEVLSEKERAMKERAAWFYALQAVRKMRHQGINVFNRGTPELFSFIDSRLSSYQHTANKKLGDEIDSSYIRSELLHPQMTEQTERKAGIRY